MSEAGQNAKAAEMAALGRAPVFNIGGHIRGFGSRPGAPNVGKQLGVSDPIGTTGHNNAWRDFFGPLPGSRAPAPIASTTATPPVAPGSSTEDAQAFGVNQPATPSYAGAGSSEEDAQAFVPTNPQDAIAATVDAHSTWLKNNGIPVPPPMPANPSAGGYTVTSQGEAAQIATQYAPKPIVKNNWGDPLPAS